MHEHWGLGVGHCHLYSTYESQNTHSREANDLDNTDLELCATGSGQELPRQSDNASYSENHDNSEHRNGFRHDDGSEFDEDEDGDYVDTDETDSEGEDSDAMAASGDSDYDIIDLM